MGCRNTQADKRSYRKETPESNLRCCRFDDLKEMYGSATVGVLAVADAGVGIGFHTDLRTCLARLALRSAARSAITFAAFARLFVIGLS